MSGGPGATAREIGRVGVRKLLQRTGIVEESATPLTTDPAEIVQLLAAPWYDERLGGLADELARDPAGVRAEAAGYLREMAPSLDERAVRAWRSFSRWLMRAYDVLVDEDQIAQLRKLDRKATLAFAFSHRSYLDGLLLPEVIQANRLSPALTFGGANLNFFPMGAWAKRTGTIFIRRQTKDIPVYRFALRAYAAQLVQNHANLTWSIEGGRTRTGKLRPPVYGILRYISDAVDEIDGPEVYLVPTSIVYDQLHEVEAMTTEAYGATKRPEDFRFLIRLARQQGERLGRAYLDFGEPLPLRKRLEELRAEESGTGTEIERIALDVEHRINRATPVTPTAVVSLALLGADRSLSISEVLATVRPLASYIAARNWTVAGAADLTNRSTIRWTLHQLVASGVVSVYDAGTEPVWGIGADQHLVAAFYRNTAIHILVDRAIAETALLAAIGRRRKFRRGLGITGDRARRGAKAARVAEIRVLVLGACAVREGPRRRGSPDRAGGGHQQGRPRGRRARGCWKRPTCCWRTWCCARSWTPTTSSPIGWPPTKTNHSTRTPFSPNVSRWASSGSCSAGWPAPSRGRWSCSRPRCGWPGIANWWTASRTWMSPGGAASSPTRSPRPSGGSTPSRSWPGRGRRTALLA